VNAPTEWSPLPKLVAAGWLFGVVAAVCAVLIQDRAGRVLLAVAAVVLFLFAAYGTFGRPRLSADLEGVTVRSMTGRRRWAWDQLDVRVTRTRRLGREISTLELDAGDDLVVLGRIELGAEPEDVADALHDLRH
jgi:Bacterial PH domain